MLKILALLFLSFCHNAAWASPIEPAKWASIYIIMADGAISPVNKERQAVEGFEVPGNSMGIMLTDIMIDDLNRPVLKIGVKARDPLVYMHIWYSFGDSNKNSFSEPVYLYGDNKNHQYTIDFTTYNIPVNRIRKLYIYFENNIKDINVEDISINKHSGSFSETMSIALEHFLRPKLIERADVNETISPRVFKLSLIAALNILAIIILITVAIYYLWLWSKYKKTGLARKGIMSLMAGLMILWMISDIRNIYNEVNQIRLAWEGYLKPGRSSDSIFYDFKGYYEFLGSVKDSIPPNVSSIALYAPPSYIHILMAKYFLYPVAVMEQKEKELLKIFYKYPFAEIKEDKLYYMSLDGKAVSGETGTVMKKYSRDTFIFLKAKNE